MVKNLDKINAFVKYIVYYLKAKHRKGHGIHSPAVYEFVSKVLYRKTEDSEIKHIKKIIHDLSRMDQTVAFNDLGAGSAKMDANRRKIKDIVKYAGVGNKQGEILYRIVDFYKPKMIVELGTSLGISTLYLSAGLKGFGKIISVEANRELTDIAKNNLENLGTKNFDILSKTFDEAIPDILTKIESPVIIFIDGNHTYEATIEYFEQFRPKIQKGMIIIGDIYWSVGMDMAWKRIKELSGTTVDLYYMGVVFVDEMLTPGHYTVRY